jgi:hypothetical protein
MKNLKVIKIESEVLHFENNVWLSADHEQECCENHWIDFSDFKLEDFEGMLFDFTHDDFFDRIEGYGIALKPTNDHPVRIPCYGSNNGYYSSNLTLELYDGKTKRTFDITECQEDKY